MTEYYDRAGDDVQTLTCRYCGTTVFTDDAVDVETPVGPVSVCGPCYRWKVGPVDQEVADGP